MPAGFQYIAVGSSAIETNALPRPAGLDPIPIVRNFAAVVPVLSIAKSEHDTDKENRINIFRRVLIL
jgi:hypothetical protein